MTREQIEKRLAELEAQREQALANANALSGAIQDCRYWLEQLPQPGDVEMTPEQLAAAIEAAK